MMNIGGLTSPRRSPLSRLLDWYVGIPLIFLLGIRKKKKVLPSVIKNIGILQTFAIGDTILLTGPIQDLRNLFPKAQINLFLGEDNYALSPMLCQYINIIPIQVQKPHKTIAIIRQYDIDVFFDCGGWPRVNALYALLSRSKFKIGFETEGQHRHYIYDLAIRHNLNLHELDNFRNLVRPLGHLADFDPKLCLPPRSSARTASDVVTKSIVFHPWAGGSARIYKMWPESRWIALGQWLHRKGFGILITGSSYDREPAEDLERMLSLRGCHVENLAGNLSLLETALLLRDARAVVSVDTGIMHLASVVGARVVSLHGPTSPVRWGGIGPTVIPVTSQMAGCGYLRLGFEAPKNPPPCMNGISVDLVQDVLEQLLAE